MSQPARFQRVFITGGSGFVGRYVVRELLDRGHHVTVLVRSPDKFSTVLPAADPKRLTPVHGTLFDNHALPDGLGGADAVIHLVGIITETSRGQTFDRVHRQGTEAVVAAAREAGVRRFVHMSALGTRPGAVSDYHRSKWQAEECVRTSGLDWTIFRPSIIHGVDGEFMKLMKTLACNLLPPVMPCFGSGQHRLQPIWVGDVAHCLVEALHRPRTVAKVYELGGPRTYNWREIYALCQRLIPGARRWKPVIGQPVLLARLLAATIMQTPLVPARLKFNKAQVQMSQEDSVCDHTVIESELGFELRDFETESAAYAADIH